ncbi:MAG TPA: hypothetical protein ENK55_04210, partial [Actinobacteria bacterium]|nr:hypothetical protein [Actinomycetota bacterium]
MTVVVTLVLTMGGAGRAGAVVPGENGEIVYEREGDIWVMNADGTDQRLLYAGDGSTERDPVWSPDGTKLAFVS